MQYDSEEFIPPAISIDIGSGRFKCGFSGEEAPLFDMPTICGRTATSPMHYYNGHRTTGYQAKPDKPDDKFFGEEVLLQRSYLTMNYFIENGVVVNWDNYEYAMHHMLYKKMKVEPECHPVILNSLPHNPRADKEKATQIMFETFNIPAIYFANSAQMALFASGRTFGVSLLCGDGVSLVAPFTDDLRANDVYRMNFGGRDLNDYLLKLVMSRGKCSLTEFIGREVMREIKESGYFTCDTSEKITKKYFTLPDGSRIVMEEELLECTEPLFNVELISSSFQFSGLHEMLNHSISNMPIEYRKDLYSNIVLSGGTTLFNGFKKRLESEMDSISKSKLSIIAPSQRNHSIWLGQSIYSSLESFQSIWKTKEEYDESGPGVVSRRPCW
ncbi:hypothetical protein NAEGRDRAFT_60842 [Naegleria gruberi]|uniref:Actin n=1 Tax=Naegleria gruberi TaxID=5762 RepID=D2VSL4_NAEGR|nr:uncharacterized protein NAEGRDRAFT_60842 [Naegleria gruberi]EFC40143.1 hypothetical protein NAEGRDRAFT_60842 [Naegleria gruberi]|eukprot:XP_002672887.1 hypothetical protein NAEGRDRAFT_60842 [Naegleria gruberi strain NEG-M]